MTVVHGFRTHSIPRRSDCYLSTPVAPLHIYLTSSKATGKEVDGRAWVGENGRDDDGMWMGGWFKVTA